MRDKFSAAAIDESLSLLRLAGFPSTVASRRAITIALNAALEYDAQKSGTIVFDYWACARPLTKHWGSGQVWERICKTFGTPDVAFGKTDGIPEVDYYDLSKGDQWATMPQVRTNQYEFGYWDPPYDKLYKKEGIEIWRTVKRLAILHTYIWPRAWLKDAEREAMVAITMGPMKQIRCLQVFKKKLTHGEGPHGRQSS